MSRGYLPAIEIVELLVLKGTGARIVFPDGEIGYVENYRCKLGSVWCSGYWNKKVEVVEMSEDGKTVWVEECND